MKQGVFCLSIDVELLWGRHDKEFDRFVDTAKKEREIITQLLSFCSKHAIGVTWAVVGHLFLNSCKKIHGVKHSNIICPHFPWVRDDWFSADPCSNLLQDPLWYGVDIVKQIKKTPLQEIASHSFSHVLFGEQGCSRQTAISEIQACVDVAKNFGITLSSFVFPVNSVGYIDVVKKYGFTAFRGTQPNIRSVKGIRHHIEMLIDFLLPLPPVVSRPYQDHGLINLPASMYFASRRGKRKYIAYGWRLYKAKLGIDRAIKEKKVFHLWTHPIDLVDGEEKQIQELKEILLYAVKKREEGVLQINTMKNLANYYI